MEPSAKYRKRESSGALAHGAPKENARPKPGEARRHSTSAVRRKTHAEIPPLFSPRIPFSSLTVPRSLRPGRSDVGRYVGETELHGQAQAQRLHRHQAEAHAAGHGPAYRWKRRGADGYPSRTPRSHAFAWVRSAGLTPCEAKGTLRPPGLPVTAAGSLGTVWRKSFPEVASPAHQRARVFPWNFGRVCHGP